MSQRAREARAQPQRAQREREQPLAGGVDNAGAVVRVGATVRRPVGERAPLIHAFLRHLVDAGFEGAPRLLGIDEQSREMLTYIDGEVATAPKPAWVTDPGLLDSIARLQSALHEAARGFAVPPEHEPIARRPTGPIAAYDGPLMCHQDLCESNVVVRDGEAVAFIDFDLAAPCDPVLDIAIAAHHWVPLSDPADLTGPQGALAEQEIIERFGRFCDGHRLARRDRERVVAGHIAWSAAVIPGMRRRA